MDPFFGLSGTAAPQGTALLVTVYDDIQAQLFESLLQAENIPYLRKDRGAGGAVRLFMGNNLYGTDLYVATEDLERAKALFAREADADSPENINSDEEQS